MTWPIKSWNVSPKKTMQKPRFQIFHSSCTRVSKTQLHGSKKLPLFPSKLRIALFTFIIQIISCKFEEMKRLSRGSALFILCFFSIVAFPVGCKGQKDQEKGPAVSFSEMLRTNCWDRAKTIVRQAQAYFFPPNIEYMPWDLYEFTHF